MNVKEMSKMLIAILLAFLIGGIFILCMGKNPFLAYQALFEGAFGSTHAVANTLSKSVPLIFTGLAVVFASKGGLLNIGAEGQLYIGGFCAAITAFMLPMDAKFIVVPLCLLGAFIGGGLWGGLAGTIKAKFEANEVIVCIMLNYIATLLTSYLVNGPFKGEGMSPQTDMIADSARLTKLIPKTQLDIGLFIGLIVAVVIFFFFKSSVVGYKIRAVGENASAAKAAGISITANIVLTMFLSGGIAALAGATEVLGKYGRFIDGFSPSFGFTGIAVAVLSKDHPLIVILTAILFGALDAGAIKMSRVAGISSNMVVVIQGIVILLIAAPKLIDAIFVKRSVE